MKLTSFIHIYSRYYSQLFFFFFFELSFPIYCQSYRSGMTKQCNVFIIIHDKTVNRTSTSKASYIHKRKINKRNFLLCRCTQPWKWNAYPTHLIVYMRHNHILSIIWIPKYILCKFMYYNSLSPYMPKQLWQANLVYLRLQIEHTTTSSVSVYTHNAYTFSLSLL